MGAIAAKVKTLGKNIPSVIELDLWDCRLLKGARSDILEVPDLAQSEAIFNAS
jgi:hypothetical protein